MPSGPSYTGSPVASIEGGNNWMDQVNLQIDLMRRQQSMNIEGQRAENARASKEREASLQNAYDFDTSSFSPKQAEMMASAQKTMADNISGHGYQTSQMLTHDVAALANMYNKFKAESLSVKERSDGYLGVTDLGGGLKGQGDQAGYDLNSLAWDGETNEEGVLIGSGYGTYEVNSEPGSLGIMAQEHGVDGIAIGEGPTNIMGHQAAKGFFQQSITEAAPWSVYNMYENENSKPHPTKEKAISWANAAFKNEGPDGYIHKKLQEQHRRENPDGITPLTEEEMLEKLSTETGQAWTDRATAAVATPIFDFQRSISGMPVLIDDIDIVSENEELAGKIKSAEFVKGLNLEELNKDSEGNPIIPIEVGYVRSGILTKVVLDPAENLDEFRQLIQGLTGSGLEELLRRSEYGAENEIEVGTGNVEGIAEGEKGTDIKESEVAQSATPTSKRGIDFPIDPNNPTVANTDDFNPPDSLPGYPEGASRARIIQDSTRSELLKRKRAIRDQIKADLPEVKKALARLTETARHERVPTPGRQDHKEFAFGAELLKGTDFETIESALGGEDFKAKLEAAGYDVRIQKTIGGGFSKMTGGTSEWEEQKQILVDVLTEAIKEIDVSSGYSGLSDDFLDVLRKYSLEDEFTPADLLDYVRGISDSKKQAETQNTIISIYNNGKYPYLDKTTGEILSSDTLT
jgi:hypothetical protein